MEIYRPGSGPLRRSGSSRQDGDDDEKRSVFTGYSRELDSSKKSDFIPNKHFENPSRKKENFPRGQSKVNGFSADNYSTFNLRRKLQKKTQTFYEPPNEWSSDKRSDRPRVNFVNPDDSKDDDDDNWRAHKAPKIVSVLKTAKRIEEKSVPEKMLTPVESTLPLKSIPEKIPGYGNRKRDEKKTLSKSIINNLSGYENWPPRFQKKFCDTNNITMEDVELYLKNVLPSQNDHNKQHSSYQSRSQTLPPRSGKGRFNESPRHEQVFYRSNPNQHPPKTEVRRVQSTANSSTESSRQVVDFDLPTKKENSHQDFKQAESNSRNNSEDNLIKPSLESVVLFPGGTIVSIIYI